MPADQCLTASIGIVTPELHIIRDLPQAVQFVYPCTIVSDNGTELTSNAILAWRQQRGVECARLSA
jgi:putative transposase